MKIKSLLMVVLIAFFSSAAVAQSVVITSHKVTYRRPKTVGEHKRSFTVNYPKIKAASPAIAKKIESTLDYQRVFNFKIKQEINEIHWLEEADYDVKYNKNGILGVTLYITGSGAYPDGAERPINIDLKTGAKISAFDVFENPVSLIAKVKTAQQAEVKKAIAEIRQQDPETENPAELFSRTDFRLKDLHEFSVDDRGVTFWYDYGFPHVIKALEPEGRYFFSWAELKPFIKRGGLLGRFVR